MKQYEKKGFNVEQALKFVKTCHDTDCSLCEAFEYCHKIVHTDCVDGCIQYLMSEVPKPQIKTPQDFHDLYIQFCRGCRGHSVSTKCKYCTTVGRHPDMALECFHDYVCKTQEVPDNWKGENEKDDIEQVYSGYDRLLAHAFAHCRLRPAKNGHIISDSMTEGENEK